MYFFGKPTDINDGWMNNTVTTVRRVSSKRSLSVLLSAVETSRTKQPAAALA